MSVSVAPSAPPSLPRAAVRERPAPPSAARPPRRSMNLRTRVYRAAAVDRIGSDSLSLLERIPPTATASALVKSARHAFMVKYQRLWLELRARIVLATGDAGQFVSLFSVHAACVKRKLNAPLLKITRRNSAHAVWIRFDDERAADAWEKALINATQQRVVAISDFEFISPIGKGASGKVFLVADRKTGHKLALKVLDKNKVFESNTTLRHALDERLALQMVDGHPFFSRLRYAFQTRSYFYLAIDFYDGGDLYQYLKTHSGRLREPHVKCVSAQVLLALEHLHALGFVYRDLKPENVLLDSDGHVRLADFGLCKFLPDRTLTNSICGTHTYAAPEMLSVRNYGKSVDLWAFGVFVYHMLRGRTPYEARELDQVIANMNNRRIRFSSSTSGELVNMVKRLLDWNPDTRLGCGPNGCAEVREHPFFHGMDWRNVYLRQTAHGGLFGACEPRTELPEGATEQPAAEGAGAEAATAAAAAGSCAAAYAANEAGETPGTLVVTDEYAHMDALDEGQTRAAVLNAEPVAVARGGGGGGGSSSSGGGGGGAGGSEGARPRQRHSGDKHESLRERMKKASAEQDDLRNFDMSEWGKISVDQDYDDVTYGDHALWPVSKARRKIVEEERLIVGYAYCSSGAPFAVPGEL